MILISQLKLHIPHEKSFVKQMAAKSLGLRVEEILDFEIVRRSIDARKKPELYYVYSVLAGVANEKKVLEKALRNKKAKEQFSIAEKSSFAFPKEGQNSVAENASNLRPVIVGAGPAGLFCAYYLALAGLRPIVLERGKRVEERMQDVERFWQTGKLDPNSNVQFGEGGAGTFSDGKLNTLVKDKEGRNHAVLETFVKFGAKEEILYDAKPHIGTDELSKIIAAMRNDIIRLGGEIRFQSTMTELLIQNGKLCGIVVNGTERLDCEDLVLAIGHSARDTFYMLYEKGIPMEAKPFAVGFRAEHPQEMINLSQYGTANNEELGAAPYKVTAKTSNGRSVYSFCMCPGGYVVNASSEEGRLAVNGMSYSGRDGKNANSAVIVTVSPEDYGADSPLSGIAFQRALEEKAYQLGDGKIPVQRFGNYEKNLDESEDPTDYESDLMPCCKGEYTWADLRGLLPEECRTSLIEGMHQFGRQIHGFDRKDCILSGIESRTSSPVRILRDDNMSSSVRGIYPCGEGAGYAGGITSAAMDGLRVAQELTKRLTNQ
ncbi:MAG: NAD(P)-binding protein [Lachnospiraceae bacterium]|nr:NAD(P)-binding protein [Lachnospiraceae bacterium]